MRTPSSNINTPKTSFTSRPFNYVDEKGNFTKNRQTRVYNVQTETKNAPSYQQFNAKYAKQGIQAQDLNKKANTGQTRNVQSEPNPQSVRQSPSRQIRPRAIRKKNRLAKKMVARMKVSGVNSVIFTVGSSFWLIVQLPLAIFSTVLFGMAAAVYSLIEYRPSLEDGDGWFIRGTKTIAGVVTDLIRFLGEAASAASIKLFGFNFLTAFDPLTFFMITYVVLFGISIIMIFTMYTAYKLMRLNPIGGSGSAMKHGALLLTMVGYSLPILNIFPWFMVWAGAVWLRPK